VLARISVKQFMANNEMNPRLIGQVVRANRDQGNLRALLNSNRPVSMVRYPGYLTLRFAGGAFDAEHRLRRRLRCC
jgi:hypothetical protein